MELSSEEVSIVFTASSGNVYSLSEGVIIAVETLSLLEVGIFTHILRKDCDTFLGPCGYVQVDNLYFPIVIGKTEVYGGFMTNRILFLFNVALENMKHLIVAVDLPDDEASALVDLLTKLNVFNAVQLTKKSKANAQMLFNNYDSIYQPSGLVSPNVERLSRSLVGGAFAFSSLASKGASFCQSAIEKMGQKALAETANHPVQKYHLNPHLRRTLHCANVASKTLASLTAAIVRKSSKVSAQVLKSLVKKGQASVVVKRLPAKWKDTVFLLGSSAFVSSGIAIHGVESALFAVGKSFMTVTSNVVKARHGIEAGNAAANALQTAGSTALLWHNLSNFTVRSIAERGAQYVVSNKKDDEELKIGDHIEILP